MAKKREKYSKIVMSIDRNWLYPFSNLFPENWNINFNDVKNHKFFEIDLIAQKVILIEQGEYEIKKVKKGDYACQIISDKVDIEFMKNKFNQVEKYNREWISL